MFAYVCFRRCLDNLGHRRLGKKLEYLGVLYRRHMNRNVGLVILIGKSLYRTAVDKVFVFGHGIGGPDIALVGDDLLDIPHPHDFQHLPVQFRHVVHLGGLRGQLHRRLILHDPLGHCRGIGI